MRTRQSLGFTLIELLVVIAIISILASILFPVFSQAKGAAKKIVTVSNMKQIGLALAMYMMDHDDVFPVTRESGAFIDFSTDSPVVTSWTVQLYPYTRNREIFYSPEDRLNPKGNTSFAVNAFLEYAWNASSITDVSNTVYLTDRTDLQPTAPDVPNEHYSWWTFTNPFITDVSQLPGTLDPLAIEVQISPTRYTGEVAVYLFTDSHAKALKFEKTWGDAATNMHYPFK